MGSIKQKILDKIYRNGKGWSFSQSDFTGVGSRSSIDVSFHRLVQEGRIRRVIRGIYDYPKYSNLLGKQLSPDIEQVVQAIARKFGWCIQSSGPTALNMIGLSAQVPSKYVYLSDGPSKLITIGRTAVRFKKTSVKEIRFTLKESALIVAAFRSLGKERLSEEVISTTRKWLHPRLRSQVKEDTANVTGWIYCGIKKVCR